MIEIVLPKQRERYASELDDMCRLRHEVCIEKWGWEVPGAQNGLDVDQFDNDEAVYMLLLDDETRRVNGCCRFNPTTGPYMVKELWSDACDLMAPPEDPRIWEASRFVVRSGLGNKELYLEIMWRLSTGMCEFCVWAGIEEIVWYTDPPFYAMIAAVMDTLPMGRPVYCAEDDKTYLPGRSKPNTDAIARSRAKLIDPNIVLTALEEPAELSAAHTPEQVFQEVA